MAQTMDQSELQNYIHSPKKQQKLYRRTLTIVVLSQIFGGLGLSTGSTVGALLAQDMLGTEQYSGVPAALFTLGSAIAALLVGRISQRYGRRFGLSAGFLTGGIGAIGVIISAVIHHVPLLFFSLLVYGAGTATNLQARYTGTDLANSTQRATAVSIALISTTFGAVAGPNLVDIMGQYAEWIGVPALAGPFILSAVAFTLAGLVMFIFLRPDPLIIAKALEKLKKNDEQHPSTHYSETPDNKKEIVIGATIMVLSQFVMLAIMTMTPIHMTHHGHSLREVGWVIGIHLAAMYLPSLITGFLVDRIGRITMAIASGITLLSAGVLAAASPADSMFLLTTALALLGLGWNFGLISGTALIVDATSFSNRAKTQGLADVFVALAGASGGALSGVIVAHSSYATLSLGGALLSLLLIPIVFWARGTSS
jgi:MFS family permease